MAEILGIVSGAAGLTSLVLQLADSTSRLRKAYKLTKKMSDEVEAVARDLDFICMVAERLHCTDGQTTQSTDQTRDPADRIIAHCKASIQALVEAMEALSQKASSLNSQKGLKTSAQRLKWMSSCEDDLESLRRLAHNAQWKLMLLGQLSMCWSPPVLPPNTAHTPETSNGSPVVPIHPDAAAGTLANVQGTSTTVQARRNRALARKSCLRRGCTCCCHKKGTVDRRFWAFKYTPLSMILGNCDNPKCDRREYIYSFRVALSQLGFPWAVTATLGIQSGCSIGLALRPQHIVRYTSPGFELLYKLEEKLITLDEGILKFTEMYRENPSFIHQVNPAGQGYIQALLNHMIRHGGRKQLHLKVSLLRLFAEFEMTQGLDDINLIYMCMQWAAEGLDYHIVLLEELIRLGFDPLDLGGTLPKSDLLLFTRYEDLFYAKWVSKLIILDPEFGHTSSIQRNIIESPEQALGMIHRKSKDLDFTPNFLGQMPLHWAVIQRNPELVQALLNAGHPADAQDYSHQTPLLYTAILGDFRCAKVLLSAGAEFMGGDPSYPLSSTRSIYHALRCNRPDYLFEILRHVQTSSAEYMKDELCSSLKHIFSYMAEWRIAWRDDIPFSCDDVETLVTLVDNINFELDLPRVNDTGPPDLLLHFAWAPEIAEIFIQHGYTAIDRKNGKGETALMVAALTGYQVLVQLYIGLGVLVNDQDQAGFTALMWALQNWHFSGVIGRNCNPDRRYTTGQERMADYPGTAKLLLEAGAEISKTDGCQCPCSTGGCTAMHMFPCQFPTDNEDYSPGPFVAVEWLNLLEELGREEDSKASLITFIRRSRFEELQLNHTCCEGGQWRKRGMLSADTLPGQRHAQLEAEMKSIEGLELPNLKSRWIHQVLKCYESRLYRDKLPRWKEVLNSYHQLRPTQLKNREVPYTIDHHNDRFVSTWSFEIASETPILKLAEYVLELEVQVMVQQPVNQHDNLEEWYERRLYWVVEFMSIMNISLYHLIKGIQDRGTDRYSFHLDSDTMGFMISHFIDSRAKYLARRSTTHR